MKNDLDRRFSDRESADFDVSEVETVDAERTPAFGASNLRMAMPELGIREDEFRQLVNAPISSDFRSVALDTIEQDSSKVQTLRTPLLNRQERPQRPFREDSLLVSNWGDETDSTTRFPEPLDEAPEDEPCYYFGGEPPANCKTCNLIVIFGPSGFRPGKKSPIKSAIQSALRFQIEGLSVSGGKAVFASCLKVIKVRRKADKDSRITRYFFDQKRKKYRGSLGKWTRKKEHKISKSRPTNDNPDTRKHLEGDGIERYDVLAIYHGTTAERTASTLKWLTKYLNAPVRNLFLWSCWGAEKIDIAGGALTDFETWNEEQRAKSSCPGELCVYTAPTFKRDWAVDRLKRRRRRLQREINKINADLRRLGTGNPRLRRKLKEKDDELRVVRKALRALSKSKSKTFALPLSIETYSEDGTGMKLRALRRQLIAYCPLKTERAGQVVQVQETLPGLRVGGLTEVETDFILAKSIRRTLK